MKNRIVFALLVVGALLVGTSGCGEVPEHAATTDESQTAATEQATETETPDEPESSVTEERTEPETPEPPKKEEPREISVTLAAGTAVTVALLTHLRTDSNAIGDPFKARVTAAVIQDGITVIPSGAEIQGSLTDVEEPHRTKGRARMTLQFEKYVDAKGRSHAIEAQPLALEADPEKIGDREKVGGGAAIGGLIGAVTSKDKAKGAAIGAAIGAAAGGAAALATKGGQLDLEPGQQFVVELEAPVTLPVRTSGS